MEMKGVIADTPCHSALVVACLVGLALDARVHNVVPADGAVVNVNIPSPECDGTPLLDLKDLVLWGHLYSARVDLIICHSFEFIILCKIYN